MAKKRTDKARVEINRMMKRDKHFKNHPNDKHLPREKQDNHTDTCTICGGVEHSNHMDYRLVGDIEVKRCRACKHRRYEGFHNVIQFPAGLRKSLPKER